MNQKKIGLLLLLIILIFSSCAGPKVYKVGIIGGPPILSMVVDGFKEKMASLGYIEGKNIIYDVSKDNLDPAFIGTTLKRFITNKVDLIMAYPVPVAVAAKEATTGTKIPVVFDVVSREGNNLVASVREPGGNVTGVQFIAAENEVKRFEMLLQIAPKVKRVFIAYDPKYPTIPPSLEGLRSRAKELGVALVELPVQKPAEIVAELARRTKAADTGIDAIQAMNEANNNEPEVLKAMLDFGKAHKIPVESSNVDTMMDGAILSFAGDLKASGGLAAVTADKILKGTPVGTIPVVTSEDQLRINLKVIKELGLTVPEDLLTIAVEVIR